MPRNLNGEHSTTLGEPCDVTEASAAGEYLKVPTR
jgi:hypothetical protein